MSVPINAIDHTGETFEQEEGLVVLRVVEKLGDTGVYLVEHHIRGHPDSPSAQFFMTDEQLEIVIIGYETGVWLHEQVED